ncbi:FAD-dependent oxidoreductase [Rhizobium sp. CRIBSB]|nr:FAD-dependent oxidoreductase [Rhizobium sp. CRIBSB]
MTTTEDVVILGGGCAGLALARELALRRHELRIVVLEPRTAYTEDRTWCFWARHDEALRFPSRGQWACWKISTADRVRTHAARDWRYHWISSADYYADAEMAISRSDQVELRLGVRAEEVIVRDGVGEVSTSAGTVTGRWVIDTRPPARDWLVQAPVAQLFSGVEVETAGDVFEPKVVTLMGNLRAVDGAVAFDYILPLSPRRALVEHTVLTTRPHDPALLDGACDASVSNLCGREMKVLRRERGWLPMGLPPLDQSPGPVVRAGTPGGAIRPSSGYAFRRIQTWAARCADALVDRDQPLTGPLDPPARSLMDRIFLRAFTSDVGGAPDDFSRMATALEGDGFARFMSDEARGSDWARLVASLPKIRYLKAAARALRPASAQGSP